MKRETTQILSAHQVGASKTFISDDYSFLQPWESLGVQLRVLKLVSHKMQRDSWFIEIVVPAKSLLLSLYCVDN